jgi:hypothetical protein
MWNTFKAVLWGFFGIRSSKGYDEDRKKLKVQHVIAVGICCALVMVLVLVAVVKFITAK